MDRGSVAGSCGAGHRSDVRRPPQSDGGEEPGCLGGMVSSGRGAPAARRFDPESGRNGEGLCGAGADRLRGHRQGALRASRRAISVRAHRCQWRSSKARWDAFWPSPRIIRSSSRTRISCDCRTNWRAPKTASPWSGAVTTKPLQDYNTYIGLFPQQYFRSVGWLQAEQCLFRCHRDWPGSAESGVPGARHEVSCGLGCAGGY